jgi:hypothetical protein
MVLAGNVEIPHHVFGSLTGLRVHTATLDVPAQPMQEGTPLLDTVVAGREHFERVVEISSRASEESVVDGVGHLR